MECSAYTFYNYTFSLNNERSITAIGSLNINGQAYDVSFDGAFGDSIFLGDMSGAAKADSAIDLALNTIGNIPGGFFPYSYPLVANIEKFRFQVAYSSDQAYNSIYSAGWTSRQAVRNPAVEATFRIAIPNSIVPLPPTAWLFTSGLLGLIGAARRKIA